MKIIKNRIEQLKELKKDLKEMINHETDENVFMAVSERNMQVEMELSFLESLKEDFYNSLEDAFDAGVKAQDIRKNVTRAENDFEEWYKKHLEN